jgi:lipoprotein NlpD
MMALDMKIGSIRRQIAHGLLLVAAAIILVGCTKHVVRHAPIVEHGTEMKKAAPSAPASAQAKKPVDTQNYVVQKGDTMYSIAFIHGVDYRELAELNNIDNPGSIQIGQTLRVPVPVAAKVVESKQVVVHAATPLGGIKSQPKVGKLRYSDKALAQADAMQEEQKDAVPAVPGDADEEENLEWGMPSNGKVIAEFSESENRKGVDIAGKRGQAVVASSAGKVVYSGNGLRGYGKLVIIKHNKTFLSAYAHNDLVLVKEGQSVGKGQKIAEMGDSDSDQVKLHFEIRKFGKPVDPAQYLPLIKP